MPHSSLKIPKQYWKICLKNKKYIKNINLWWCDYLTDKLIPDKSPRLIFNYSRLFCDVEKFKDNKKEVMAKYGLGVFYTHDGQNIITMPNKKYKSKVLKSYYDKHHNKLDKVVTNILNRYDKCLIIDLHSFSDELVKLVFDMNEASDICIGIDNFYTDTKLIDFTTKHFKEYGYSVNINYPYSGTIIPNKCFKKKEFRLKSIMLEINKRVYLNNSNDFYKLKECITIYYEKIQKFK